MNSRGKGINNASSGTYPRVPYLRSTRMCKLGGGRGTRRAEKAANPMRNQINS